ncbi:hypothetical protein [Dactylosporangium darangshiense]|uniref:N-acetyltransferase domain-containing protein n=1 Tax=Dactylosporangium darangshiense TaxID=579108 RepID=A0ABP8D741_9ACTN
MLRRLRVEAPGLDPAALSVLATVDGADEELLAALLPPARGGFDGLARLSVVRAQAHGLDGAEHGFHMLVDGEDRPVGMVNLRPLGTGAAPVLEPLLQQHAEALAGRGAGGAVVGMMVVEERYARFQPLLVRQILAQGIAHGRLVVSTPWLPYQQMCARFGLRRVGQTRDDLYRCGRANAVYARGFRPGGLPGWLGRLQAPPEDEPDAPHVAAVRAALEQLRAGRPAGPPLGDRVLAAVMALAASPSPVDREAAAVLGGYYVRGAGGHDLVAHALHLSRATYLRRLRQGLARVAELLG